MTMTTAPSHRPDPATDVSGTLTRPGRIAVGLSSLILGVGALVASVVPLMNLLAAAVAVVGFVLGLIALFIPTQRRDIAIGGIVVSAVAAVLSIVLAIVYMAGAVWAISDSLDRVTTTETIVYKVIGDSTDASITYTRGDGGETFPQPLTDQELPFIAQQVVTVDEDLDDSDYTVTATNGATGGDIRCVLLFDGIVFDEVSSSGAGATVTCTLDGAFGD